MALSAFGLYASMLLVALYTQKLLSYDAWNAGLVLAPGGIGNLISLVIAGRLVARVDQRMLLALGCVLNAIGLLMMSNLTLSVDYWTLAIPRFVQGLARRDARDGFAQIHDHASRVISRKLCSKCLPSSVRSDSG